MNTDAKGPVWRSAEGVHDNRLLPAQTTDNLPAITGSTALGRTPVTDSKITVNLVHPTNSGEILTAAVSPNATPRFLVDQMVQAGFLPPAHTAGQYKLRNAQSGRQLLDDVPLADADIPDGVTLAVDHATTGAIRA